MAVLYISEYPGVPFFNGTPLSMVSEPATTDQTVAISGSSAQSSTFKNSTNIVRLNTDTICSVLFGTNPTALTTSKRLAANQTEYFGVLPGQKVAVITNT